jgi:hypothetical protein
MSKRCVEGGRTRACVLTAPAFLEKGLKGERDNRREGEGDIRLYFALKK